MQCRRQPGVAPRDDGPGEALVLATPGPPSAAWDGGLYVLGDSVTTVSYVYACKGTCEMYFDKYSLHSDGKCQKCHTDPLLGPGMSLPSPMSDDRFEELRRHLHHRGGVKMVKSSACYGHDLFKEVFEELRRLRWERAGGIK